MPEHTGSPLTPACAQRLYQLNARSRRGMLKPKERTGANRSARWSRQFPSRGSSRDGRALIPTALSGRTPFAFSEMRVRTTLGGRFHATIQRMRSRSLRRFSTISMYFANVSKSSREDARTKELPAARLGGTRTPAFYSVVQRAGGRTGSDQSVTSVAPLPVVHARSESQKVVRPVAPSTRAPGRPVRSLRPPATLRTRRLRPHTTPMPNCCWNCLVTARSRASSRCPSARR